jgi:hypothetical protein
MVNGIDRLVEINGKKLKRKEQHQSCQPPPERSKRSLIRIRISSTHLLVISYGNISGTTMQICMKDAMDPHGGYHEG